MPKITSEKQEHKPENQGLNIYLGLGRTTPVRSQGKPLGYASQRRFALAPKNLTTSGGSSQSLILSSKLPQAKEFKRWITSEVLPSIRKNGAYMTEQTLERALTEPDFLIQLATQLKEERNKRLLAEQKATRGS